ncbi:MAG: hypothetical protein DWQ19_13025 [Crenarchaeota archaeon]|nr:MAG: hypothetical protein DWQ19_13025 [Thermoproteota archaeon]
MSLDWSLEKVHNWEELANNRTHRNITDAIVFKTMAIGISEITEKNYVEFYQRIRVWEQAFGASMYYSEQGKRHEWPITLFDVKRRIGLFTNASRLTEKQFLKLLSENLFRDQHRPIEREKDLLAFLAEKFGEPEFEKDPEEQVA